METRSQPLLQLAPQRIVMVRALPGLGDMLCLIPAARALRRALPEAHIALLGLPWARTFNERFPAYFDQFLELPGFPGLTAVDAGTVRRLPHFLSAVQEMRFDLALQLHGSGAVSNPFTLLLGARKTAGFYLPSQYRPSGELFFPYPEEEPEVRRNLRLLELLGAPADGEQLEFPLSEQDWHDLNRVPGAADLKPGEYLCLHAGARAASRRWLPQRFARTARELARMGYPMVLTGSEAEFGLNEEIRREAGAGCINLAGPMSLGALAALLSRARLLICNDTGVSHLAAALKVPSVIIFTAADPRRWAPLDSSLHRAVWAPVDCRPCGYEQCPIGHPCAAEITPEMVLQRAGDLLSEARIHAA